MNSQEVKELIQSYRQTFGTPEGLKVLSDLEARFNYHASSFSKDSNEMAYLEGQRSVVITIKNLIKEKK